MKTSLLLHQGVKIGIKGTVCITRIIYAAIDRLEKGDAFVCRFAGLIPSPRPAVPKGHEILSITTEDKAQWAQSGADILQQEELIQPGLQHKINFKKINAVTMKQRETKRLWVVSHCARGILTGQY